MTDRNIVSIERIIRETIHNWTIDNNFPKYVNRKLDGLADEIIKQLKEKDVQ